MSRIGQSKTSIASLRRRRYRYARALAEVDKQLVRLAKPAAKFHFYQRVLVVAPRKCNTELLGQWGTVRGKARETSGQWGYAVRLDSTGECWDLQERELASNGEFETPPPESERRTIRVRVDSQGRGTIVSQ